jgi:hypothetical protein
MATSSKDPAGPAVVEEASNPPSPVPKTPPIKDPNPPDAEVCQPAPETPKVGSRDAPGG